MIARRDMGRSSGKSQRRILRRVVGVLSLGLLVVCATGYVLWVVTWLRHAEDTLGDAGGRDKEERQRIFQRVLRRLRAAPVPVRLWDRDRYLRLRLEATTNLIGTMRDDISSYEKCSMLCNEAVALCKALGEGDLYPLETRFRMAIVKREFEEGLALVQQMQAWSMTGDFSQFRRGHFSAMLAALECHCRIGLRQYAQAAVVWRHGSSFCQSTLGQGHDPPWAHMLVAEGYMLLFYMPGQLTTAEVAVLESAIGPAGKEQYLALCKMQYMNPDTVPSALPWHGTGAFRRYGLLPPEASFPDEAR